MLPLSLTDILVGVHLDDVRHDTLHGCFHQMLCCAHAQLQPQEEEGTQAHRYLETSGRHTPTQGESPERHELRENEQENQEKQTQFCFIKFCM